MLSQLKKHHIGICDIVDSAFRDKVDASDAGMRDIKLRDLIAYLEKHKSIHTLLFTGGNSKNGPEYFFRKFNIKISDIFVIFYYDIFDFSKTFLATLDIKMHYLCTWKNIIDIVQKNEILSNNEIENLKLYLNEPEKWRLIYE